MIHPERTATRDVLSAVWVHAPNRGMDLHLRIAHEIPLGTPGGLLHPALSLGSGTLSLSSSGGRLRAAIITADLFDHPIERLEDGHPVQLFDRVPDPRRDIRDEQ